MSHLMLSWPRKSFSQWSINARVLHKFFDKSHQFLLQVLVHLFVPEQVILELIPGGAPMAESLLMPLVNSLLRKATDAAVQQFGEMWGIDKKRKRLQRHLLAVQRILVDAEHRAEREPDVKAWMRELKEAAYKAEDVLDELEYRALRQKAESARGSTAHKVKDFFTSENPAVFRLTMNKKITDILGQIDEVVSEMNKFNFSVHTEPRPVSRPQTISFVDAEEVIGRNRDKEKIVGLLLSQHDNSSVAVLPIVGMGGLGKTTLMQLVYNADRVKQHFELLVWVCASDNMTTTSVAKSIIEGITKQSCGLENNTELLQQRLRDALGCKRYLLALDDVWNEEREKWEELKVLLSSASASGRVIMVTSRSERVASIMGTLSTYRLEYLDDGDSWNVFQRKAFSMGVEQRPELVTIGKSIVKKCAGVPLAVKTMGSLMSTKYEEDQWYTILESEVCGNIFDEKGIKLVLKLSYDHLPPYMKQCFAFCALFPKDHLFRKDLLIQLWMANGFVPLEGSVNLDDKGSQIFDELAWRSFFQDIQKIIVDETESHEIGMGWSYDSHRKVTTCKMHDLAASIMEKECQIVGQFASTSIPPEVHHLYVTPLSKLKTTKGYCSLRTLLLLWRPRKATTWHHDVLKSAHVRVLDTQLAKSFPAGIPYMKHLRYLDLSSSGIQSISENIRMLYHLQTLKLSGCIYLRQLPECMRYMSSLRHLFLVGCCRLKCMPTGIGRLTSLRTLTDFIVDDAAGRGIEELKCLNLVGQLHLYNLRKVKDRAYAKEAGLISKRKINCLMLCWGPQDLLRQTNAETNSQSEFLLAPPSDNGQEVLEALEPHDGLQVLKVSHYTGIQFSLWMKDPRKLQNLMKLYLTDCKHCMEIPPVWQLPSLEFLLLEQMDSLTHVRNISGSFEEGDNLLQVFPALKMLKLLHMRNLEHWDGSTGNQRQPLTFPRLVEMEICCCPKLENMPVVPQLRKLEIRRQNKMSLTSVSSLHTLTELTITTSTSSGRESSPLDHVISYKGLDSLHTLNLVEFNNPMRIEEEENKPVMVEGEENDHKNKSVHTLDISFCDSFFTSETSGKGLRFWRSFVFLEKLKISYCNNLFHWPVEEFQDLRCLKSLSISSCKYLTGFSPGRSSYASSEQDLLPHLEELQISFCDSLQEIPVRSASLKSIYLTFCRKLSCLPERLGALTALENLSLCGCESLTCLMSSLGNLVQLKSLVIDGSPKLSALPDGMGFLTALRNLDISNCPRIKSLPHGLLRLRSLKYLLLMNCPSLQKRCRREEEYRDFVSHIRDVQLLGEEGWSWPFPKMRENGCEGIRCLPGL